MAPMSVFACLGSESTTIRDAYIHRLKSHVEVWKNEKKFFFTDIDNFHLLRTQN